MLRHPLRPPMTLGNMRELEVKKLIVSCLNDACRHTDPDRGLELPGRNRDKVL